MKKNRKTNPKLQLQKLAIASMNEITGGKVPGMAAGGATSTVTNWVSMVYAGKANCVIHV